MKTATTKIALRKIANFYVIEYLDGYAVQSHDANANCKTLGMSGQPIFGCYKREKNAIAKAAKLNAAAE